MAGERDADETGEDAPDDRGDPGVPLDDLAERVRAKDSQSASPLPGIDPGADSGEALEELFSDRSITSFDSEAVWQAIDSGPYDPDDAAASQHTEDEHVVPKQWYCERCEYFNDPPKVRCNHEGTTIVEFVGVDQVRVRNCPVVAERQALGEFGGNDMHPSSSQ